VGTLKLVGRIEDGIKKTNKILDTISDQRGNKYRVWTRKMCPNIFEKGPSL
jgi:hypothetical protein